MHIAKRRTTALLIVSYLAMASCGSGGSGGSSSVSNVNFTDGKGGGSTSNPPLPISLCGPSDNPETGIQGDKAPMTGANCGLTMLSWVPGGGAIAGSGHCAYVRLAGTTPYTGTVVKAYDLSDPTNPVETDETPSLGGSESIRAVTTADRAVLVAGSGVYDVSNCEDLVLKGEIQWPSFFAQMENYATATSSHEIALSHDAKRVYTGIGFGVADISNLEDPSTWAVKIWICEMNVQSGYPQGDASACDTAPEVDYQRQYSHSSDENLEGTRWYGANQIETTDGVEIPTLRVVDISVPGAITLLDEMTVFPGHSMTWWRTPSGKEFVMGANEDLVGTSDTCQDYPRPKGVGNAAEAYIAEVTNDVLMQASLLTLDINKPENCDAATASGVVATITEHAVYNKNGAAFGMIEFGDAGLRIFDLRDGYAPKEVAYFNTGNGHVHSGLFHYDDARGLILASGSTGLQVLEVQPQIIDALGLPYPTDPNYPYSMNP